MSYNMMISGLVVGTIGAVTGAIGIIQAVRAAKEDPVKAKKFAEEAAYHKRTQEIKVDLDEDHFDEGQYDGATQAAQEVAKKLDAAIALIGVERYTKNYQAMLVWKAKAEQLAQALQQQAEYRKESDERQQRDAERRREESRRNDLQRKLKETETALEAERAKAQPQPQAA